MVAGTSAPQTLYRPLRPLGRLTVRTRAGLLFLGEQAVFFARALGWVPRTLRRYPREVVRQLADVTLGTSLLLAGGGTVGVIFGMASFVGVEVGLEGYQGLQVIGLAPFSGFLSAYANTREIAPIIAAVALASQLGCRFTAQLGAMRISDEVDALEVMAIPSLPYLVSTRIVAAFVAVIPLYLIGLFGSYLATRLLITVAYAQSSGTYQHYFHAFLAPRDIAFSLVKVLVFAIIVTLVHCYYGYTATGGPEGVGRAAGRAIRVSSVCIAVADMLMSLLFFASSSVRLSG